MTDINVLICERITNSLNEQHRSITWLSRQSEIPESTLLSRLSGETAWTLTELGSIANSFEAHWGDLFLPDGGGAR